MSKPTLILCHGAWHSVNFFDKVIGILEPLGYRCVTVPLPSIGRVPPSTGIDEDINAVRTAVLKELEADRDVVMHAHSWGGIPVSSALNGLGKFERQRDGLTGGVTKLTYVAAMVIPEDVSFIDAVGGLPPDWVVQDVRTSSLFETNRLTDTYK